MFQDAASLRSNSLLGIKFLLLSFFKLSMQLYIPKVWAPRQWSNEAKTSVSLKSLLSLAYQCSNCLNIPSVSPLTFSAFCHLINIASPLFYLFTSGASIHASPLDKAQWPQVRFSPETIKMSRGLGLRSQVMLRMSTRDPWDWNA